MPTHLTEDEQNALLLKLYAAAKRVARSRRAEDQIHDFIANCLVAMRNGSFNPEIENMDTFVRQCLRCDRMDLLESRKAAEARDAEHLVEIVAAPREWMDQSLALDSQRLQSFTQSIRDTLDPVSLEAHRLVREDRLTYAQAGRRLHVSPAMIHKHVTTVQCAFRHTLFAVGIQPTRNTRGGRIARPVRRASRWRRRPILRGRMRNVRPIPRTPYTPTTGIRECWSLRLGWQWDDRIPVAAGPARRAEHLASTD
jgi:DNA-directed RNA polymerase specialized sigma24 family protein